MVFMEVLREREKERAALGQPPAPPPSPVGDSGQWERQRECLEHCLQSLPSESRELIMQYHQGERRVKIENRQKLAEQLNIPLNALRIRSHRIREKLEACVDDCLKR
jgi:DNA-directed RNA polymerase specialized sigma24 family protein